MMNLVEVRGDHYEIGFQIGQATAAKIAAVLSPKPLTSGFRKRAANVLVDLNTLRMKVAEGPTCRIREYVEASV